MSAHEREFFETKATEKNLDISKDIFTGTYVSKETSMAFYFYKLGIAETMKDFLTSIIGAFETK